MKLKISKQKLINNYISKCQGCGLENRPLPGKGHIPCDILLMTNSPKRNEMEIREPLINSEFEIIINIIRKAKQKANYYNLLKIYRLNSLLCYLSNKKQPSNREAIKCKKNIIYIIEKIKPKLIILLGNYYEQYYINDFENIIKVTHPEIHLQFGTTMSPTYQADLLKIAQELRKLKPV